ncbi:hypothetical protein NMM18_08580 [Streptococcus oralis]|uniref:hypothetical protein n=1 Tax=Streptococcus oralis TaxID=1303 RepID=UPI0020C87598|nr:hypothetical protein [Streptococcus oralis]MCP9038491.1 hypothetical protein [Streptococcus oralis]MCP9053596.1 hypothetical protein [Streptococcus oralis]MCP9059047.1 hypothetical protein [Streptococcus oralis]MCP9066629.1 hypothetical protein [Streptococcus oralis]MCP9070773.1 hypothetical protein [Streptococcus oralis]
MRKIIFIGQSGDKAVYYNTRTREALVADKSALLNTEGARKSNSAIIPLMFAFVFLGIIGGLVAIPAFSDFRYNSWMVPPYIVAQFFVCFGFIWMMEEALYKEVKQVQGASSQQFAKAVDSNLFWDNFSDKKATFGKMLAFMIVMLLVFMTTIVIFVATIPSIIDSFNKQETFDIQIFFSLLAGLFPAVSYLLLFQNNPIRWLLAVRKYEQGKVIFRGEIEKRE